MKIIITFSIVSALALMLSSCTKDDVFRMGGVPSWIANGAKIEGEPEPFRPDPAIAHYDDDSGPVNFTLTPEKKNYATYTPKKKSNTSTRDPFERGRAYRIKRLVR
jgi:hypothetical protein|tara:strand:+ start:242 stop:559 length:318 start_codon:yes stop_codon:yes gene_type:complete